MFTGRVIPPDILLETIHAVPASVEMLAPLADYCVRVDNSGRSTSSESRVGAAASTYQASGVEGVGVEGAVGSLSASSTGDGTVVDVARRTEGSGAFTVPSNKICRGVIPQGAEGAAPGEGGRKPSEADAGRNRIHSRAKEGTVQGRRESPFEPVLPDDFPVLATPGETWASFRDMFTEMTSHCSERNVRDWTRPPLGNL